LIEAHSGLADPGSLLETEKRNPNNKTAGGLAWVCVGLKE
jgi:hypothetical protein